MKIIHLDEGVSIRNRSRFAVKSTLFKLLIIAAALAAVILVYKSTYCHGSTTGGSTVVHCHSFLETLHHH